MSDLISRSTLIDSLMDCKELKGRRSVEAVVKTINEQPTVEAKPSVTGEWLEYPSALYRKCSACKMEFEKQKVQSSNFCPNCGADMRSNRRVERKEK